MNRERILLALLGGSLTLVSLACGGRSSSGSDNGSPQPPPAPNPSVTQISQIAVTQPVDTDPVNSSEIDLSKLDTDDEHAFDTLFK